MRMTPTVTKHELPRGVVISENLPLSPDDPLPQRGHEIHETRSLLYSVPTLTFEVMKFMKHEVCCTASPR
jgi:hypothetical protein